ncbi:MAG TPA: bifunctional 2-C-methyl-D-erythritol 4-phosphate cytidylyltransferase/2-C-methyl-D-erythritol 2,4-cyclodiphosphate synthase [Roseiarcus sp.]|nr:bifunctional 2-C-methyl-D-erythritol 4-phosphate cytidylyltransferase/2-C-methyl-D-erythritol 2,4-cyclodiphosphate synthase [Roseiarcus sp.]
MPTSPKVSLIVLAAGRGTRLGGDEPKQYRLCAGRPLLCHTLESLAAAYDFAATTVVIHPNDRPLYDRALSFLSPACAATLGPPALGGATRQESGLAGLAAQEPLQPDLVLIHDGARAFPPADLILRAVAAAAEHGAAAPGLPLSDTIKEIDQAGIVVATPIRANLRAMQTPQAFRFDLIYDAHRRAARERREDFTDDAAIAEWAGWPTHIFPGAAANVKITEMSDLVAAEARLMTQASDIRIGQGFDVHAFAEGDGVWLGGVHIPHDRALAGHSDADVALHAITDALLGAIGDGDIGAHFPPSDEKWRGAPSRIFLEDAARRVRERGGLIANIDATIICERPKIGPHRDAMRARIAEIAGLAPDRVAVKATTSERLGFTGRGEGIACLAVATVRLRPAA